MEHAHAECLEHRAHTYTTRGISLSRAELYVRRILEKTVYSKRKHKTKNKKTKIKKNKTTKKKKNPTQQERLSSLRAEEKL